MTNESLSANYLVKARIRTKTLKILYRAKDYSDVVREAQEIVELALKALLRYIGIEPPKWHDVGPLLVKHQDRFPSLDQKTIRRLAKISKDLREDRELAFYGDNDFIPSEEYNARDAQKAIRDAGFTVKMVETIVKI